MLAEAALSSIAEAVLNIAYEALHVEDHLRGWLRREPSRLAFEKALVRAYAAFARNYPELTASLFDASFLSNEAAPELAKLLTRNQKPDPARLAELWSVSLGARGVPAVTRPAADFLNWLESELKAEPVFQLLFDSRALESLPALESRLGELVGERRRALEAEIKEAKDYGPIIAQLSPSTFDKLNDPNIRLKDPVTRRDERVTDISQYYFSGKFSSLKEDYVSPDAVFQRVRVDDFVGRGWLSDSVDGFIHDSKRTSGALVIVGEAGVGKTSFLAHLAKERNYPHLFADDVGGEAKLGLAIRSLSAQLISRYQIDPYSKRDSMPDYPAQFDTFLGNVLRIAALKLTAGEKIVIVCDALDEAGVAPGGNAFGLPKTLPEGVYFILAARPTYPPLSMEPRPTILELKAASDENIEDVREYLAGVALLPEIAGQLKAQRWRSAQFVDMLVERSGGVWMYLKYMLEEIKTGIRSPLDLGSLPDGLAGYYADYWRRWRSDLRRWDETYAPLLATLAAAQEPISMELLVTWSGVSETPYAVRRLMNESWKAFVRRTDDGDYGLYHASLRDYLIGEAAGPQRNDEVSDEMRGRTRDAHRRIADHYRQQCGGDWPRLVDNDYARRYLTTHLDSAGLHAEIAALVTESNAWAEARSRKEESYSGYLLDLDKAWRWADSERGWDVGLQLRCALIESSIHSLALGIRPELLAHLVQSGLWSPVRALALIQHLSNDYQREAALTYVVPVLPDVLKTQVLHVAETIALPEARARALSGLVVYLPDALKVKALDLVADIDDEGARARALIWMIQDLPDDLKAKALGIARDIHGERARGEVIGRLSHHLPQDSTMEVLGMARQIAEIGPRAQVLTHLIERLPNELKESTSQEVLLLARELADDQERATTMTDLLTHLSGELSQQIATEALTATRKISDAGLQAATLCRLANHFSGEMRLDVLYEALAVANGISFERERATVFGVLATLVPGEQKSKLLDDILVAVRDIQDPMAHGKALVSIASQSTLEMKAQILEAIQAMPVEDISDEGYRVLAGIEVMHYLPARLTAQLSLDVWAWIQQMHNESEQGRALGLLAPYLSDELRQTALAAARELIEEKSRAEALIGLIPYLSGEQKAEVLLEALAISRRIDDEPERANAFVELANQISGQPKAETLNTFTARGWTNASALVKLSAALTGEAKDQMALRALAAARKITDAWSRAECLSKLAESAGNQLRLELLQEALSTLRGTTTEPRRASALGNLVGHLPDEIKNEVVEEALTAARRISDSNSRAWSLANLIRQVPIDMSTRIASEALDAARAVTDEWDRVRAIDVVAGDLPPGLITATKTGILREALRVTFAVSNELLRVEAFSELQGYLGDLPGELQIETWAKVQAIRDERLRADAIYVFAPQLPPMLKDQVLSAALSMSDDEARALALSSLTPDLPPDLVVETVALAQKAKDPEVRVKALTRLAMCLERELQIPVLSEAMTAATALYIYRARAFARIVSIWRDAGFYALRDHQGAWVQTLRALAHSPRSELLDDIVALIPLIYHLGGEEAIGKTLQTIREVSEWWP